VLDSALSHAGIDVMLGRTALPGIDSMACPALAIEVSPDYAPGSKTKVPLDDAGYETRVADALAAGFLEWKTEARQP
jgi:N-acetylmuramoyl-L-alanine amidase